MNPVYPFTTLQTTLAMDAAIPSGYYVYFTCTPSAAKKFRLLNTIG
jgi:hypothetical protein